MALDIDAKMAFLPRVTIPVLVFSGELDYDLPARDGRSTVLPDAWHARRRQTADHRPWRAAVLTTKQARKTLKFVEQRFGPVINAGTRGR
jgi:hypothetical protein